MTEHEARPSGPHWPTLHDEELGRYKMILWECYGSGYNASSGLLKVTNFQRILAAYLNTGGKLWLGGRMTVAATIPEASGLRAILTYPIEDLGPGNFAYDFLKLLQDNIKAEKGQLIVATHNPLMIGSLRKNEVRVFAAHLEFAGRLSPSSGLWLVFNPNQESSSVTAPPLEVPVPLRTGN